MNIAPRSKEPCDSASEGRRGGGPTICKRYGQHPGSWYFSDKQNAKHRPEMLRLRSRGGVSGKKSKRQNYRDEIMLFFEGSTQIKPLTPNPDGFRTQNATTFSQITFVELLSEALVHHIHV